MKKLALIAVAAFAIFATSAQAFNHKQGAISACSVSGSQVTSTGLPTNETLNFLYLDANGGYLGGYVIGVKETGTTVSDNRVNRPASDVAFYAVTGQMWGNNQFVIYAECAA